MRLWLRSVVVLGIAGFVFVAAALAWLKWHEAELVFQTQASRARMAAELPAGFEQVAIALNNGDQLAALLLRATTPESGYWVLHLHGNADSAFSANQQALVKALASRGLNVLAIDYRGFGRSPGEATETHMYEDAEAGLQWLIGQRVPPGKIILWGHSLGSGPAVHLARRHPVAGLVMFGAFTSIDDAAAEAYPWLPVRWVVGIHFNNLERISSVRVPVVIAHAVTDRTIPYRHAERLFAAANEPKRLLRLQALSDDGLGGHVNALYEQLEVVWPVMEGLMGVGR